MTAGAARKGGKADSAGTARVDSDLLQCAYTGDIEGVRKALDDGADINTVDEQTGLSALHIAVGTNNIALTRFLLEDAKATIAPDGFGRWPTVIAAECRAGEELCDYIVEAEAKAQSS